MRFITFASVILIASTLNGCSKTGTSTPVTNSTSTSVRATQTSKKSQSADTNAVNEQKVEEQVNVKVSAKSTKAGSSTKSIVTVNKVDNSGAKDSEAAKTVELATPSTSEASISTDGLEVPATADAATTTYEDPFEGLEIEETPKASYTPEEINQMKRKIYTTILDLISYTYKGDFKDRLTRLVKADTSALNVQYIDNILYSNIDQIMELNKSIEDAKAQIENYKAILYELIELRDELAKCDDLRKEILTHKIEGKQASLLNDSQIDALIEEIANSKEKLNEIYFDKMQALIYRQGILDQVHEILIHMEEAENVLGYDLNIRAKIEELEEFSNIASNPDVEESELNMILGALGISQALSREEIMEVIGNIITDLDRETYVAKYGEGEVERFNAELYETESRLNKLLRKDKELILEQVEITYPKKMHSTHA
jgi:hypothetical protein